MPRDDSCTKMYSILYFKMLLFLYLFDRLWSHCEPGNCPCLSECCHEIWTYSCATWSIQKVLNNILWNPSSAPLGHSSIVITHSPPLSKIWAWIPALPQVRKLVVAYHWQAVYSTEPWQTVCTGFFFHARTTTCHSTITVKVLGMMQNNK